ncbi:hypothetical protein GWK47_044631 [Chionoecetes opilio]|uniref:Uncharacterized protein n=1 Tax=Chionoecetes opilio TaxID=41210 RepID=A0A8J4Y6F9_CHIOP|nr:hypothetical protein GWK47_044631 [Chionoecetes opilio]
MEVKVFMLDSARALKMFHILETRPPKGALVLAGTGTRPSTASPLVSTGGFRLPWRLSGAVVPSPVGPPFTCSFGNTTSAAKISPRCSVSRERLTGFERGLGSLGGGPGGVGAPPRRGRRGCCPPFPIFARGARASGRGRTPK